MSESVKPEPAAYLTEHEDHGPMLFLDRVEASSYCAEGEEPQALYTADQMQAMHAAGVRAGMLRAAQIAEGFDACDPKYIAAAIRSEAEREGEK
jgi:predicted metal-dependent phosphotriesterase family hydrolase